MDLPDFLWRDAYGEIFLTGHRICLQHVVGEYTEGASPEQIALTYPTLKLATIHKVIAFYLENREEADEYVREVRAEIEKQMAKPSSTPTYEELRKRMAAKSA